MRKWHRWLSVCFGIFLLWIAVTGVLIQITPLFGPGEGKPDHAAAAPAFVCPPDYTCRPKPRPGGTRALVNLFQHLHSGEIVGLPGHVVSTVAGIALIFFAGSGLWLYIQMWRGRSARGITPRWFWK